MVGRALLLVSIGALACCDAGDHLIRPDIQVSFIEPPVTEQPAAAEPSFEKFPSAAAAITALLAKRPMVVGFGEYHSTVGGANVVASLRRFRDEVFPNIAGTLSDVIVETWVEPAGCGKKAQQASTEVKEVMNRPEETETDVFALLREAREKKLGAHILEMSCDDYASFRSADKLDYDKPLSMVTGKLLGAIEKVVATKPSATVAVYGGTMHNDLHPVKGFADYSYAPRVTELTKNRFMEIDLFVPELIAKSSLFIGQPWFEVAKREASSDQVVVIKRGPASYVVVLKSGVSAKASP